MRASAPTVSKTLDDEYAELASKASGFGGLFVSDDGSHSVAYLTTNSDRAMAERSIRDYVSTRGLPSEVRIAEGTYDFRDLLKWRREIERSQASIVTLSDVDERANRVRIGVSQASDILIIQRELELRGISSNAVAIQVVAP